MPNFKFISFKMAVLQGGGQNLPSPCVCIIKESMWNRVNCLSVHIVSSGGINICSRKIGKIILLIRSAIVPDHRKSLTDPLPALVPHEQGKGQYF